MSLGRTSLVHFGSRIGATIVGFVATVYFANVLGAEVLGTYFVILALLAWVKIPNFAVISGMAKRLTENEDRSRFVSAGILSNAVVLSAVIVVLYLFRRQLRAYADAPVPIVELLIALLCGRVLFKFVTASLIGEHKVIVSGFSRFVERIARASFQAALVLLSSGLFALVAGHVAGLFVAVVFGIYFLDSKPSIPGKEHFERIWSFARYAWFSGLKGVAFGWTDTLVLNYFVAASLIGIYEVSWLLASALALIGNSISTAVYPETSQSSAEKNQERVQDIIHSALTFVGVFVIPGLFGVLLIGSDVLQLYGPEFEKGKLVLVVLTLGRLLGTYQTQYLLAIKAIDRPDVAAIIYTIALIGNIILNFVLVRAYGWLGAAVATTIVIFLTLVLGSVALNLLVGRVGFPWREVSKQVLAAIGMSGILVLVTKSVNIETKILTIVTVVMAGVVYLLLLSALSTNVRRRLVNLIPS